MKSICAFFLFASLSVYAQILTPLEKSKFQNLSSNSEIINYLKEAELVCKFITLDTLTNSPDGKVIPFLKVSNSKFGKSKNKVCALIFAQQHGNEPSGKEGILLLIKDMVSGKLNYLLEHIDIILIPQMNPDGGDKNLRRNGNGADLNRNHMMLSQPEVLALHNLFNDYLPEVTLDLHEYTAYSREWSGFGFIKQYDEQLGIVTNPNVSMKIQNYSKNRYLPFIKKYLLNSGFSSNEYIVGGPPNKSRIRYSTVDINDGRQSFGILNTLSFIAEGRNGQDSIDNIQHRAEGQKSVMMGLLEFVYGNSVTIKKMISEERTKLIKSKDKDEVAIKMEHIGGSVEHRLNLFAIKTQKDTSIAVKDFHYLVKPLEKVKKPYGYLIPKNDAKLISFINRNQITSKNITENEKYSFQRIKIASVKDTVLEELKFKDPEIISENIFSLDYSGYLFIPINQLRSNLIVLALEPKSMLGIIQQEEFQDYLKINSYYPILKVLNK